MTKTGAITFAAMNSVTAKTRAAGFVIFRVLSSTIEYLLLQTSYGENHWTPPKDKLTVEEQNSYCLSLSARNGINSCSYTSYYVNERKQPEQGHVDPGENDRQTALRETMEESGLEESQLHIFEDYLKEIHYNVNGQPKAVVYFLAELKNQDTPVKLSNEHQDFKWLPLDKACELAKYTEMQQVLTDCDAFLSKTKHPSV